MNTLNPLTLDRNVGKFRTAREIALMIYQLRNASLTRSNLNKQKQTLTSRIENIEAETIGLDEDQQKSLLDQLNLQLENVTQAIGQSQTQSYDQAEMLNTSNVLFQYLLSDTNMLVDGNGNILIDEEGNPINDVLFEYVWDNSNPSRSKQILSIKWEDGFEVCCEAFRISVPNHITFEEGTSYKRAIPENFSGINLEVDMEFYADGKFDLKAPGDQLREIYKAQLQVKPVRYPGNR